MAAGGRWPAAPAPAATHGRPAGPRFHNAPTAGSRMPRIASAPDQLHALAAPRHRTELEVGQHREQTRRLAQERRRKARSTETAMVVADSGGESDAEGLEMAIDRDGTTAHSDIGSGTDRTDAERAVAERTKNWHWRRQSAPPGRPIVVQLDADDFLPQASVAAMISYAQLARSRLSASAIGGRGRAGDSGMPDAGRPPDMR